MTLAAGPGGPCGPVGPVWPCGPAGPCGPAANAEPVPDSATVAGLTGSLLLITSAALRAPAAWGAKLTLTTQLLPASIVLARQSSEVTTKSAASVPLNVRPVTRSDAAPVLVTLTGCDGLKVPCGWAAKVRLCCEGDAAGNP